MLGGGPGGRISGGGGGGGKLFRSMPPPADSSFGTGEGLGVAPPFPGPSGAGLGGVAIGLPVMGLEETGPTREGDDPVVGEPGELTRRGTKPMGDPVDEGLPDTDPEPTCIEGEPLIPPPALEVPEATLLASHGGKVGVVLGRGGMTRGLPGVEREAVTGGAEGGLVPGLTGEPPLACRRASS